MRNNKGFGRTWARRWREREENAVAAEKAKRPSPVYGYERLRGKNEKRPAKIVITEPEVLELLRILGYKHPTAHRRRMIADALKAVDDVFDKMKKISNSK